MTDRELLQQMIDRIGKEPRVVKFDWAIASTTCQPNWDKWPV
jgi:hypothetical protein